MERSQKLSLSICRILLFAVVGQTGIGVATNAEETGEVLEEVTVFGRGETRQVQIVDAAAMAQLPAGTSPLKAIEKLPGVNFQSADPFGAYEWSTRISVRGFNQNQLGFTLDGVPLGDMSYGNHNGLHASRAVASENVGRVVLSQGAGALATASTSNLGGTLEFFTADAADEFGVRAALTGGSDNMRRGFLRVDSGELASGTKLYVSYAQQNAEKWKGDGKQKQQQINAKVVQAVGAGTLTAYYAWSDRAETDYQDLSYAIIDRRGWDWDNYYPDWSAAVNAADACAVSGFSDGAVCDDAYWNASGLRKDHLGYIALDMPVGDAVDLRVQGYLHRNEGQGLWGTPYLPTPGGAPLSIRTTEYEIDRKGAIAGASYRAGPHTLRAGLWIEGNDFNQARRFYGEPDRAAPTRSFLSFQRDPLLTQFEYDFETRTVQWYLQDSWQVSDALRVDLGFKSVEVKNDLTPIIAVGSRPNVPSDIDAKDGFLPQAGFSWRWSDSQEIFGTFAENIRAFVSAATAGPFSTTQQGFDAIRDTLDPETSRTLEFGWRHNGDRLQGVLSVYQVTFKDRLLSIALGPGIVGAPSALANVGKVRTRGFEAGLLFKIAEHWNVLGSYSFADSKYRNDVVSGTGDVVPVAGNQVVDTPRHMLKLDGGYDDGRLFARLGADVMGKRYFTYLNDQSVDSRLLLDAAVGYRFERTGAFKSLSVQLNGTNLTDRKYVSTIGSNGFGNSGDAQTLLRGAPRQVFVTLDARF